MRKVQLFYKPLIACLLSGLLGACVSAITPMNPGAENIKVSTAAAPKVDCQFLGKIGSSHENGRDQSYTSHENLQADELNIMRNQALNLGANLMVITEHKTIYGKQIVAKENFQGAAQVKIVDWHSMAGNAYRCSAAALNRIVPATPAELSDLHHHFN